MIILKKLEDFRWLDHKETLPKWYLDHLYEFFLLLFTASNQEVSLEAFTLEGTAEIMVLELQDQAKGLRIPSLSGAPSLLELQPEYVGKLYAGGHAIYRITFMLDNERMLFVFSLEGQFTAEVEEWFKEQLAWSAVFVSH